MSKFSRRTALARGGQAVAAAAMAMTAGIVPTPAPAAQPDPLCEGVQALVNEIRQELSGRITMASFWALQEVADRLEALPGIRPVANEGWQRWKPRMPDMLGYKWPALRPSTARRAS